jgi:hypothetical protein
LAKRRHYFQKVVEPRLDGAPAAPESLTLREFADRYIARYRAIRSPATVRSLRWRLVRPLREFGDLRLDEIRTGEVAAWEASLPPRFRHDVTRAFRMVGKAAVEWGFLTKNPAATGANPAPPCLRGRSSRRPRSTRSPTRCDSRTARPSLSPPGAT